MQTIELFEIDETGADFLLLKNRAGCVRITFADGFVGTKEENASFFHGRKGKLAALPVTGPLFIGVDFFGDPIAGELQTVPIPFDVALIERTFFDTGAR